MNNRSLKRWTFLDTINAALLIVVLLFMLDFENNRAVSFILLAVFAFWITTVILRNIFISKIQKDPNHPMHPGQSKERKEK
ncbi:hypothetical protein J4760_09135 [Salinicoccus sp. ID82-1]|uniref:Uncharacterized protein n=1 Tax=Salinicoccus cyprini TaxID=2493691 RepID=A0A558AR86_9STAP|nr:MULTISPECIES: hypothetical protein [Salinicoccus]MCG1010184.1 hypothetical protein [Salinicoccus sp. ID82-1]TVT26760.1 hypothetical protein FO441_12190 [Salinicoccus cyprini]